MDWVYVESGYGLYEDQLGLHELLCGTDGEKIAGYGAAELS